MISGIYWRSWLSPGCKMATIVPGVNRHGNNRENILFKESLLIDEETFLEPGSNFLLTYHWLELHHRTKLKPIAGKINEIIDWSVPPYSTGSETSPLKLGNVEGGRRLNNIRFLSQRRKEEWQLRKTTRITNKCKNTSFCNMGIWYVHFAFI